MSIFFEGNKTLFDKGFNRITPFFVPYIITNMGGGLLAIDLGFTGPTYSISTACATANYSIVSAAQHIERGDADIMVCGGSEAPINPIGVAGFVVMVLLSARVQVFLFLKNMSMLKSVEQRFLQSTWVVRFLPMLIILRVHAKMDQG